MSAKKLFEEWWHRDIRCLSAALFALDGLELSRRVSLSMPMADSHSSDPYRQSIATILWKGISELFFEMNFYLIGIVSLSGHSFAGMVWKSRRLLSSRCWTCWPVSSRGTNTGDRAKQILTFFTGHSRHCSQWTPGSGRHCSTFVNRQSQR